MSENDVILLDNVLEQQRSALGATLEPSEFFEVFAAEQALKDYDLSYDELETGIVGGTRDGGIDGLYFFANGELVLEDTDLSSLKKGLQLELVFLQATTSKGFAESRIDKLRSASEDLLDFSKPLDSFGSTYAEDVIARMRVFRDRYQSLANRFPRLTVRFVLSSRAVSVHPELFKKAGKLRDTVQKLLSNAAVIVNFFGAPDLLSLARRAPRTTYALELAENPISSAGQSAFVSLVRLNDYYRFITDGGNLQRHLFEANVRDYQGATEVNEQIGGTLRGQSKEDFWWLNNGITIVGTKAVLTGKTITVEDPQIVNGLQTSTQIFNYFTESARSEDTRTVLVRVIVPEGADSRDKIIKATNSQTPIPPATLRATDKIHRDIEDYFKLRGLYYDRRKNSYKNQGVPVDRVVGIGSLAQGVMAIALRRPDNARSRPSSLLKRDEDYAQIFSPTRPLALYYICAAIMKRVEAFLRSQPSISLADKGNVRFHVAMAAVAMAVQVPTPSIPQIADLSLDLASEQLLSEATDLVCTTFNELGATDSVAKSSEFLSHLRGSVEQRLLKSAQTGGNPLAL